MKINFHYHCIKALAVEAGLEAREAQLIAYASQHVDDAVEHRTLTVNGCAHGRRCKPVCSAHKSIWKLARAVKKPETWYKVFVPFHFIPPAPRTAGKTFSYRVKKDSGWIKRMIARAVKRIRDAEPGIERDRALVRLGIPMHVYADTWSHAVFSGVNSIEDNAVMEYDTNIEDDNPPVSFDFPDLAVPPVGHGQALGYPDQSSRNWLVVLGKQKRWITCGKIEN